VKFKHLVFFFGVVFGQQILGQSIQNSALEPIETRLNWWGQKFIYKNQIIDQPLALQIPLLEAKDPEVSYEFLKFKSQKKTMRIISGLTTAFALYSVFESSRVSDGFYWSVAGTAALGNVILASVSMKHLNKALKKYNSLVPSKISFQVSGGRSQNGINPQLGISYQF